MGYKMPNVVKEVYIPYPIKEDGNSFANMKEYEEYYGIHLEDIFNFKLVTFEELNIYKLSPKNPYTKFYLVAINTSGFAKLGVQPLIYIDDPTDHYTFRVIESEGLENSVYSYWKILGDKTFEIGEI